MESIRLLIDQDNKGCKLTRQNKAVMSANFTEDQERFIQSHGFSTIKKPFRLTSIDQWLEGCADRLNIALT